MSTPLLIFFSKEFTRFDNEAFQEEALERHGYLYPDTYLFAEEDISPENLIEIMTETFKRRTDDLFASYTGDLSRDELVTLASIVELEASRQDDRRRIASVLFNRLEQGVPLQVDVSFLFISGKHTFKLSREDLAEDDLRIRIGMRVYRPYQLLTRAGKRWRQ